MSDVRKLIARLNAPTARFDMGRSGGKPELTAADIAGALGMIPDELAREVFCAIWWQDGARLSMPELLGIIQRLQTNQLHIQLNKVAIARLEAHIAEDNMPPKPRRNAQEHQIAERMHARLKQARDACWPAQPEMFSIIRHAVLSELTSPNHCKDCGGRGELTGGELVIRCRQCDGTGAAPTSDRQRAMRINRDPTTYAKEWKPLYEWTYELLRNAEFDAIRYLREALK